MTDPILSLDDPRLTAYALGELPPEQRAAVEAFLAVHPEARVAVAETAAAARQLEAALAFETQADPDAQVWGDSATSQPRAPYGRRRATLLQFPQLYFVIGGLAAACVAVLVALHDETPHAVRYYRVAVTPPASSEPAAGAEADTSEPEPLEEPRAAAPSVRELAPEIAPLTDSLSGAPRMATADKLAIAPPHPQNPPRERAPQTQVMVAALRRAAGPSNAIADVPRRTRPPIAAESVDATWPLPLSQRTVAVGGAEHPLGDLDPALHVDEFSGEPTAVPMNGSVEGRGIRGANGFVATVDAPSAWVPFPDGDTGITQLQAALAAGHIPAPETIHIGAWLNAVANDEPAQPDAATSENGPVRAWIETAAAPWAPDHRLVRIGVRGRNAVASAGLEAIAAEAVAVQVAFDPAHVTAYRLIGYDAVASESNAAPAGAPLAAGRSVTALFEIIPVPAEPPVGAAPLLTVRVHFRVADGRAQQLLLAATDSGRAFAAASGQFRFAAGVAAYGMVLQASPFRGSATLDRAIDWARTSLPSQQRLATAQADFVHLMELTTRLVR